jgi:hypothetical protein
MAFKPREQIDASGYLFIIDQVQPWPPLAPLHKIAEIWSKPGHESIEKIEERLKDKSIVPEETVKLAAIQASCWTYEGQPERAVRALGALRERVEGNQELSAPLLYSLIYLQGVTSLRLGETENCVMCRGENSCILPLQPAAQHTMQTGSRQAIKHFTEYLKQFPDDLEVRWLLNIAHMTLGEHPEKVDPRYLIKLDRYNSTEHGIGKFRDVGHLLGINRLNMAGGTILDDFDNDGLLDLVFSTLDPGMPLAYYRNQGDGRFDDRSQAAGLNDQLGGLNCVQADYDNDGNLDIFVPRGAWLKKPMRPSLLKNNGRGEFRDVTEQAGLLHPTNSNSAQFADFDNDGRLDLFVCGEAQPNRLFRNAGGGEFEDVTSQAGLEDLTGMWKGQSWFDYDNDDFPDIFLNNFIGAAKLLHNEGNGMFIDVTEAMGIRGPELGFSCFAWDYDNDGWLDLFATSYDKRLGDSVKSLLGQPHERKQNRLYRNMAGKRFEDVTQVAGLTECFETMGSNFGDFDNDGYLDMYLGTGEPDIATLVPNRMFRNLAGKRFVDITSSSGTGHLQKGHGVGCGDWDRDGDVDIAIEMGGAIPGDKYHNVLFLNPGQGNHYLNVKLVGSKSNRSAIGARIKLVTDGDEPVTVQRCVGSGSSFGANPLEQLMGVGKHDRVASLEVYWPTSGITQVFKDIAADQHIQITEGNDEFLRLDYRSVPLPEEE